MNINNTILINDTIKTTNNMGAITMINKISLFSGIEAFDTALNNIGIEINTVALSEIDEYASTSCSSIHNYKKELNLGDVRSINGTSFEGIDLLTHGSPCQSFSNEGNKEGGHKNSGTKSSLMWETVRIINECLPKIVVWENVPDLLNKRNIDVYTEYLDELSSIGYTNYFEILKAVDYDLPQNRKRKITVSIRNDLNKTFKFPDAITRTKDLIDVLEVDVDDSFNLEENIYSRLVIAEMVDGEYIAKEGFEISEDDRNEVINNNAKLIKNGTIKGYLIAYDGDGIDFNRPDSKTRRGRVQSKQCSTLLTAKSLGTYINGKVRYLTPLEYWRLQGFSDNAYYKARKSLKDVHDLSESNLDKQLYKQAGNSIPVTMLEELFKEIYSVESTKQYEQKLVVSMN